MAQDKHSHSTREEWKTEKDKIKARLKPRKVAPCLASKGHSEMWVLEALGNPTSMAWWIAAQIDFLDGFTHCLWLSIANILFSLCLWLPTAILVSLSQPQASTAQQYHSDLPFKSEWNTPWPQSSCILHAWATSIMCTTPRSATSSSSRLTPWRLRALHYGLWVPEWLHMVQMNPREPIP